MKTRYAVALSILAGVAVGAAAVQALHAQYAEQVTPFNRALQYGAQGLFLGPTTPFGAAGIDVQVQYRALLDAYANAFMLIFLICLPLFALSAAAG